ncbi:UvrD-helicase domain-containing protein [Actinoallomurus iriomotensis]|uniref:DNA 3'-5' helicase n=1 Tax=Actinoallomurus iriomotensis TaxID=478107 RepID=A0A9W6S7H0_9ACTN|nr:UvrD-helicase domain-containing protein [Actinoallomurus iriomotensis]GLY88513.1 DNA helicase [Actinoallomurus iriomotensis]
MTFYADLHIHSKYSRACSKDCDLEHLAWWAGRKGVSLVGTGDFTHPAWMDELRENLVPAEPGLFRLRPDLERRVIRTLPPACRQPVRFLLSVEISTIYKKGERTRKVHHLLYSPSFEAAERITAALAKIGNLASDGRPILGLDSRHLLEITLQSDPGSYLVPAHVWTPWFSVLGSKSGFDAVADCYDDLADHIFAVETGLSSDPLMNWRVPSLDRYRLVSNSDAHSPPALAREASMFTTEMDYYAVRAALETGRGYGGSVEFFPEEGKYHLDGHRKCGVRLEPEETKAHGGRCPSCGRPLTVGVLYRVDELAAHPEGRRPEGAADFRNLIPLPEIVSEIRGVGPRSKSVLGHIAELVSTLGPELSILDDVPLDDVRAAGGELLAEAIGRLRRGDVIRDAGFDGEYGVIRLFGPGELRREGKRAVGLLGAPDDTGLFDLPAEPLRAAEPVRPDAPEPEDASQEETPGDGSTPPEPPMEGQQDILEAAEAAEADESASILDGLDPDQRVAAAHPGGPLLIIAGPGTGKTRTLTHRIAHLVAERGVEPERCLAITFTRRAAEEMRERLEGLLPGRAARLTVTTFHGLGALILREQHERAGLPADFRIADETERLEIAREMTGSDKEARRLLAGFDGAGGPADPEARGSFEKRLRERGLADFADLLRLPVTLLGDDPDLTARYRERWPWISVDEYQDVDETQYSLLRLLSGAEGNLTAIGDPDQAIYAFRGADVGFFLRFEDDFAAATKVLLTRNYRSAPAIVHGAVGAIRATSLVPDRVLDPQRSGERLIVVQESADAQAEAAFVTSTIDGLLGGTSFHSLDSGRAGGHHDEHLDFSDIAVLYRSSAQAEPVMEALTRAGMPYQKRSHDRLVRRPGVREVAHELRHHGGELTGRIRAAVETLTELHDETVLRTAAELLTPLAVRCGDDLETFLGELALGAEVDAFDPRADRIALLTLHASKGLEFPVVFIVGCEDGLLPMRLPDTDEDEERRLFFVGMTRAQSSLYLSGSRRRDPSPFLRGIPGKYVTRPEQAARRRARDQQLRLI